jgi:hypothetical protein
MPSFRVIRFSIERRDEPTHCLASLAAAEKANAVATVSAMPRSEHGPPGGVTGRKH